MQRYPSKLAISLGIGLPPADAIDRALYKKSFKHFVRAAWPTIEPNQPYIHNWHIDVLCDALQALVLSKPLPVVDKVFRKLLINVPPGTMKSLIASVFLPAWVWLNKPGWKCIFAANAKIAVRDSIKCRDLIRSEWYQKTFKPDWQLSSDQDAKKLFKNTAQGFRLAVAVGEDITGERADHLGIDDPLDAADAPSKLKRDSIAYWLDQAFQNRVVSPAHSTTHMIMQRLHEEDPSGHVLEQGGYYHICLPMEFETARKDIFDPRTIEGELLFPERFPQFVLDEQKIILGPYGYAGQMQQNPMPAGGGKFKLEWWRFFSMDAVGQIGARPKGCNDMPAVVLPDKLDDLFTSWDCNFKKATDNDFVAGGLWGRKGANLYRLGHFNERVGILGTLEAIRKMAAHEVFQKYVPRLARKHLVEAKANGEAVIEILTSEIAGMLPVNPEGGKEARAEAGIPAIAAGNVYLLDSAPWLGEFVIQHARFPKGHDDLVDETSQALLHAHGNKQSVANKYREAFNSGKLKVI